MVIRFSFDHVTRLDRAFGRQNDAADKVRDDLLQPAPDAKAMAPLNTVKAVRSMPTTLRPNHQSERHQRDLDQIGDEQLYLSPATCCSRWAITRDQRPTTDPRSDDQQQPSKEKNSGR